MDAIRRMRDSLPAFVLGGAIALGAAYLAAVGYLDQVVDRRIAASDRWGDVTKANALSQLPSGALVFFDHPAGCPVGWSDQGKVNPATFVGRALVAAGKDETKTARAYRELGGNATHQLTETELAPHFHGVISADGFAFIQPDAMVVRSSGASSETLSYIKAFEPETDLKDCRDCGPDTKLTALDTNVAGGVVYKGKRIAQSFSTLSPYVALFLCRRD